MQEPKQNARIVAAVTLDGAARGTLATAARLAGDDGRISVLHVVDGERKVREETEEVSKSVVEASEQLRALLQRELGDASNPMWGRIDAQIGVGDPGDQIVQLAIDEEADFIVVGTHDARGLERLAFGSVSSAVMKRAPCSVLVVRDADYEGLEKSAVIEPPLEAGQPAMTTSPSPPVRRRERRFSTYSANVVPTGIPRREVR